MGFVRTFKQRQGMQRYASCNLRSCIISNGLPPDCLDWVLYPRQTAGDVVRKVTQFTFYGPVTKSKNFGPGYTIISVRLQRPKFHSALDYLF